MQVSDLLDALVRAGFLSIVPESLEKYHIMVQKEDKVYSVVDISVKVENQTIYLEVE